MNWRSLVLILIFFSQTAALALDRVTLVGSKLHSSLSAILSRSDYMVIVNRVDNLEDGGASQATEGSVRRLPGLVLGVDSQGEMVKHDASSGSYSGPVVIHVIIEDKVPAQTFKTIQSMIPEIVGGLRDDDELKVARGPLRVPNPQEKNGPTVNIQNTPADKGGGFQENLKFLALLLLTGGLFFWFLSRLQFGSKEKPAAPINSVKEDPTAPDARRSSEVQASDFAVLDPEAVGLFLLKAVKERKELVWYKWLKFAPSLHQREVFKQLPAWVLNFLQNVHAKEETDERALGGISLHDLFKEIVLIEQSFKSAAQKRKAFLQWFPPEALRYVSINGKASVSEASRKTLWVLRPELGGFLRLENMDLDHMAAEPDDAAYEKCFNEMCKLNSMALDQQSVESQDSVKRWINLINQVSEFGPIDQQINQAKAVLDHDKFERLYHSVAHLRSPFNFSPAQRKEWMRSVEPHDYTYWTHLCSDKPTWTLAEELRPMRLAMVFQAAKEKQFESWTEEERKKSSKRILEGFRKITDPNWQSYDREVA